MDTTVNIWYNNGIKYESRLLKNNELNGEYLVYYRNGKNISCIF